MCACTNVYMYVCMYVCIPFGNRAYPVGLPVTYIDLSKAYLRPLGGSKTCMCVHVYVYVCVYRSYTSVLEALLGGSKTCALCICTYVYTYMYMYIDLSKAYLRPLGGSKTCVYVYVRMYICICI
jgi:hypothetical protein